MGFLVSWLTLLIVALNLAGDAYAWSSPIVIGLFAGTGVAFLAFVVAENKASHPVVPMGLFVSWKYRNVPIITSKSYTRGKGSDNIKALLQLPVPCYSFTSTQL